MVKSGAYRIKFDKNLLLSLKEDTNSGVDVENFRHHLAIHPYQLNNFKGSVQDVLNRKVAKYDRNFKGILLGYQNIKLLGDLGAIIDDNCYIHVNITADFFIFKPEIGKELKGIVTKVSKDHVGCLVYNTFNASLPRSECTQHAWENFDVNTGNEVLFTITFLDFEHRLPYIRGKLTSVLSNVNAKKRVFNDVKSEIITENETPIVTKKHKKIKKDLKQSFESENDPVKTRKSSLTLSFDDIPKKKDGETRKKSKKPKTTDDSLEELNLSELFTPIRIKKEPLNDTEVTGAIKSNKKRKRCESVSELVQIKEEMFSDEESKKEKKKRKRFLSESVSPKKKKVKKEEAE